MFVHDIDQALCAGDFRALMELTEMTDFETMLTNDVESTCEQCTDSTVEAVLPQLESQLVVTHARPSMLSLTSQAATSPTPQEMPWESTP